MRDRTREALEASVVHWDENMENAKKGLPIDNGPEDCPLCAVFFFNENTHPDEHEPCHSVDGEQCPVARLTGVAYCAESPYNDVSTRKPPETQVENCRLERDFLQMILDSEEK